MKTPAPTYSNCSLAVLYLWLRGLAVRVVATPSPVPWWVSFWFLGHLGAIDERERVIHFKRTSDGQPFAPLWFEGRLQRTQLAAVLRTGKVLWVRPAWRVIPYLLFLLLLTFPFYVLAFAFYFPGRIVIDSISALRKQ